MRGPARSPAATTRSPTAATRRLLEFIAFWLSRGAVIAGMNVNVWDVTDDIQALIRSHAQVDVGPA
jgi:hypothetical protein